MSPVPTVFPSLIQVIFGAGLPAAVQVNVVCSFSVTVRFEGVLVKLGGTKMITLNHNKKSKILYL